MAFTRDPLAEQYDAAAGRLVGRALATPGRWVYVSVPRPPSYTGIGAWLAAHGAELAAVDAGGLTVWQRAYQRAVYHTFGNRNEVWSLQRCWGPSSVSGRMFGVRVSPREVAKRAVARMPPQDRYIGNPRLASGGDGSGQQRF